MNVDVSKVKVFRLLGGEELVASLANSTELNYTLYNPLKVVHVPNEDGTATIVVLRYSILSNDEWIEIPKNMVMAILTPNEDAVEYYRMSFRKNYEDWAKEKSQKDQAEKDFKELEAIINDESDEKGPGEEIPEDEKDLDVEPEKKHRSRTKKPLVN